MFEKGDDAELHWILDYKHTIIIIEIVSTNPASIIRLHSKLFCIIIYQSQFRLAQLQLMTH